ncbi:hypothetical protein IKF89_01760 [Candidatus Saccharibacteria bacterium]|nr:hypothetical protein [Candidatus Saccharibacteria bacterium]
MSSQNDRQRIEKTWLVVAGMTLIIIAIVLIFYFWLRGETKVTGEWAGAQATKSLTCEGEGIEYPIFTYDNTVKKTTKINAVFTETDNLDMISLRQAMYYNDSNAINASEVYNHAAMNLSFADSGMNPDALNASYAVLPDGMKMTLYASSSQLGSPAMKYFLLGNLSNSTNYTLSEIQAIYEKLGLTCTVSEGEQNDQ